MFGLHGISVYQTREPQGALPASRGFSLTEILIAMAIGSLLLASMTNTFMTQRRIYASREQVVEAQENVRWGLDTMAR
jgi:prepilin-type N-terminal cleavage/methylation domain-containing protein